MKKPTVMADVARAAGVSTMTVSRAVNNKPGISEEMREKILAIAKAMDFKPNHYAQGLATRNTMTIGLMVPDVSNPFFAAIARVVEGRASEAGYSVLLVNTAEDLERERDALDTLRHQDLAGVILCSLRLPVEEVSSLIQGFATAVLLNRELPEPIPKVITVNVNDRRGAQMAVKHLIDRGRSRIGFLAGPSSSVSGQRRMEGYRMALKSAGIPYEPGRVEPCAPNTDSGREAAVALLARSPDTDALFTFNDLVAAGVLQMCQDRGLVVPKDIAVVGVDDIPLATIIRPQLTTLRINLPYLGGLSMRLLLDLIEGEGTSASYQIEPDLVVRDSS